MNSASYKCWDSQDSTIARVRQCHSAHFLLVIIQIVFDQEDQGL